MRAVITLNRAGHMGNDTPQRRRNRKDLFNRLGLNERRVYGLKQIHSRTVVPLEQGSPDDYATVEADGWITSLPDPVLSITAADCLPIFLYHPESGVRGLVHSGWRGTGIVSQALALLEKNYGLPSSDVKIMIGPGIGPCCYAVSRERYRSFTAQFGEESGDIRQGVYYLDLLKANIMLLERLGVGAINIINECTCCQSWLGSYRRDGRDRFSNMLVLFGEI